MKFTIKTFSEILDNMANWVKSNSKNITNFRPGSVVRTMLESVALEIELLYYKMFKGFTQAIQESTFNSFDFGRVESTHSIGEITITFREPLSQAVVIPKGFKVSTPSTQWDLVEFETVGEIVCEAGIEGVTVPVRCTRPGIIGNISAGLVTIARNPLLMMDSVVNNKAMSGGFPEESIEERKKRFTHYIQTLAKGTVSAIEYGCRTVPGVAGAFVEEGIGFFKVYAHNSSGLLPESLRADIEHSLLDYRSAGIEPQIFPPEILSVELGVTITLADYVREDQIGEYELMIKKELVDYLNTYGVSRPLLRADLILFIRAISSSLVINTELSLEKDIATRPYQLIRPGEIDIKAHIG